MHEMILLTFDAQVKVQLRPLCAFLCPSFLLWSPFLPPPVGRLHFSSFQSEHRLTKSTSADDTISMSEPITELDLMVGIWEVLTSFSGGRWAGKSRCGISQDRSGRLGSIVEDNNICSSCLQHKHRQVHALAPKSADVVGQTTPQHPSTEHTFQSTDHNIQVWETKLILKIKGEHVQRQDR